MKDRKTGGRKKGTPNRKTAEARALALREEQAFAELARLATQAKNERVRLAAIRAILDRCYGRAASHRPDGDGDSQAREIAGARRTLARKLRRIEQMRGAEVAGN